MDKADVIRMGKEAGIIDIEGYAPLSIEKLQCFAALIEATEHTVVLQAVEGLYELEEDRNPMFSDGYQYALDQIEQLIKYRQKGYVING